MTGLRSPALITVFNLKFGDGDEPTLGRVDFSSTFIENIFLSGLILVST